MEHSTCTSTLLLKLLILYIYFFSVACVAGRNNSRHSEGKADRPRQRGEAVLPIRPVQERIENLSVRYLLHYLF